MTRDRSQFDPRAILAALERNSVDYVVIGGIAQVLRGADEITDGVDICPSFGARNLDRLAAAAADLDARRPGDHPLEFTDAALGREAVLSLSTSAGALQIVGSPRGAPKGYVDLRRAASREHLGQGVQALVASSGDLARMAAALHRDQDVARLAQLRRIVELEVDRYPTRERPTQPTRGPSRGASRGGRRLT
jgi:hypothetical protein